MEITVNAKQMQLDQGTTIAKLIEILEMNPKYLAVEVNKKLVTRKKHAEFELNQADVVEIVTLVGGG